MLTELKEKEFEQYAEQAYALALDLTKSGYPTYADGIKTKENFMSRSRKAFSRDNEGILLFRRDGETAGWIHYFYLAEDRYLDTCSFCVSAGMEQAVAEFVEFARERFPGSRLYLGFPKENAEAIAALESGGFACIEDDFNDVMALDQYEPCGSQPGIVPVTRENYELFRKVYSDDSAYWNAERLLKDIDNWGIYLYQPGESPEGAVFFTEVDQMAEIFGVVFSDGYDEKAYKSLVRTALNAAKRQGAKHMVFFNDGETQEAALDLGFRCVSGYVCYCAKL